MVWPDDSSLSPAVEPPTIIEKDSGCVSERIPSFVIAVANILLRVAKDGKRCIASQLDKLLTNTSFELKL